MDLERIAYGWKGSIGNWWEYNLKDIEEYDGLWDDDCGCKA